MKHRPFRSSDLSTVNKWLKLHKHQAVKLASLPKNGTVIPGVAIGFIRECEGNVGLFEGMVTNPHVSSATRDKALKALYQQILSYPFKTIIGFTGDEGAYKRALANGFSPMHQVLVAFHKE